MSDEMAKLRLDVALRLMGSGAWWVIADVERSDVDRARKTLTAALIAADLLIGMSAQEVKP